MATAQFEPTAVSMPKSIAVECQSPFEPMDMFAFIPATDLSM